LTSLLILFGLPLGVAVEKEVKLGRCHSVLYYLDNFPRAVRF